MKDLPAAQKSTTAVIITSIYLLLVAGAFLVMFLAKEDESLAGIFVVLVAMPWTILLTWIVDNLGIDSMVFNTVFSALACMLNAWIISFKKGSVTKRKSFHLSPTPFQSLVTGNDSDHHGYGHCGQIRS